MAISQMMPGELAAQIRRVSALREQYKEAEKLCGPQANFKPVLMLMNVSLDRAVEAAGSPDILGQMRALEDLRGYDDL